MNSAKVGNIILCSSERAVPGICPRLPRNCSVAFVRTASLLCDERSWLEAERAVLMHGGFKLTDVTNLDCDAKKIISESDVVFLGGGNTFFLLNELRRSNFDELLVRLHKEGKILAGESAGAVVLGPTIAPVRFIDEPEKIPNLTNFSGLQLLKFFPAVHFGRKELENSYPDVLREAYSQNLSVVCLRDADFAVIVGGQMELGTA